MNNTKGNCTGNCDGCGLEIPQWVTDLGVTEEHIAVLKGDRHLDIVLEKSKDFPENARNFIAHEMLRNADKQLLVAIIFALVAGEMKLHSKVPDSIKALDGKGLHDTLTNFLEANEELIDRGEHQAEIEAAIMSELEDKEMTEPESKPEEPAIPDFMVELGFTQEIIDRINNAKGQVGSLAAVANESEDIKNFVAVSMLGSYQFPEKFSIYLASGKIGGAKKTEDVKLLRGTDFYAKFTAFVSETLENADAKMKEMGLI